MSDQSPSAQVAATDAEQPSVWHALWKKIVRGKPTGAHCEYCGWRGERGDVLKAPRLNEDGAVYQIDTCPECLRNGGLIFYG